MEKGSTEMGGRGREKRDRDGREGGGKKHRDGWEEWSKEAQKWEKGEEERGTEMGGGGEEERGTEMGVGVGVGICNEVKRCSVPK
ncbi:hypothetical protein Pcinc_040630 [Petrolisthes cinctipes]|uniref:Uncharacterized protein n=1 Tax=Petrolisthes cinctipes TaxID=88211 RepID=A0AAE1BL30_PETCI|nr:hypothetical protein Pcinc_040630 [Petrolisthes cinctipes]